MDLNENGSLQAIEQLMEEFFSPNTCNSRKHEIEQQLNLFKTMPQLWKLCLYFITQTSSQYVTMFSLSTLETVINQQWLTNDWSHKEDLKNVLYNYLIEKGNQAPHFLRGKYAKLLVDIAKQEWPHRYPNFLNNIVELLRSNSNQLVGLVLLRTASEEFMGLHSTFDKTRKEEIARLFQEYIPHIFEVLANILESFGTKTRHPVTATPPPSPTHPSATPTLSEQLATANFRPDSKAINKETLNTLQHLFSWTPISLIPPHIITLIFNFTNISSYAQDDDDMCVLAMSAINELLYRKCTPPGTQDFFIQLYHHSVELLRDLATCRIESLDAMFVEKLSELLVLLIEQHFWRLEMEPNFSALEFLSLLFNLTVQIPSVQCYKRSLAAWVAFIKQIKPQNVHKYSEAFLGLASMLLKKIQFSTNFEQLHQIDCFEMDEENETEWSIFVKASIEVIAMIAEFAPVEIFSQVLVPWKNLHDIHKRLVNVLTPDHSLNIENSETERLCYYLRDFSTLTQTLARLSALFTDQDDKHTNFSPTLVNLFEKIIESASISTSARFYNLKLENTRLLESFINAHCELLAALKTWLYWIIIKNKITDQNLKLLAEITLPVLHKPDNTVSNKVYCAAAHLLLSLTAQVFPPSLVVLPGFSNFINMSPTLRFSQMEINYLINSAMCNLLLKSWGDLNEEDTARRQYMVNLFFDTLTKPFNDLTTHTDDRFAKEVVDYTMSCLSHIIDFCKHFPVGSKKLLLHSIKPTIDQALTIFPVFAKNPEISSNILGFFITLLAVLQQQLGIDGTKRAVNVFLKIAADDCNISNPSNIEKLLQIFKLIVEAPGLSYKIFLPEILQMCMQNIRAVIMNKAEENPELFLSLLTLLHSVLLHRWQYFYISQVKSGYSPCVDNNNESCLDTPQKPQELLEILQVFGQAFLQSDINIFNLSLSALEDLNTKWKLYHKTIFRDYLLFKFIAVLMQTLVEKSQTLLSEDIQIAIYNMASVNFQNFFSTFLPEFLRSLDGISPQQCEMLLRNFMTNYDKDMPTFIQHLRVFVKDAQHFKTCNR